MENVKDIRPICFEDLVNFDEIILSSRKTPTDCLDFASAGPKICKSRQIVIIPQSKS